MPIAYCKRCERIFNKGKRDICPACVQAQENSFTLVRGYLKEHHDATMYEVSEETGVPVADIIYLIRDGRLMLRDNPNLTYPCERCGGPTQAGRYCGSCAEELTGALNSAKSTLEEKARQHPKEKQAGYFHK